MVGLYIECVGRKYAEMIVYEIVWFGKQFTDLVNRVRFGVTRTKFAFAETDFTVTETNFTVAETNFTVTGTNFGALDPGSGESANSPINVGIRQ